MSVPVFILAGQSNVGFLSDDIENALIAQYGAGNYELIRVFDAGAPLTRERDDRLDWSDPDELREELTFETVNALLEDDDRVFGGMIWVQGEADTFFAGGASEYGDELDALIDGFREDVEAALGETDVGMDEAQVTILELSNNAPAAPDRIGWDTVIEGQRDVAENDAFVQTLDPDTVAEDAGVAAGDMFEDSLHYAEDFGAILAEELVQTLVEPVEDITDGETGDDGTDDPTIPDAPVDDETAGDPVLPGDGGTGDDPVLPVIPIDEGGLGDEDLDAEASEEEADDGGFGFEAILFLLPLVPLLAALGG